MVRERHGWRASHGKQAQQQLEQIAASIIALTNEDLLDLADIFLGAPATLVTEVATAEMARRGIRL